MCILTGKTLFCKLMVYSVLCLTGCSIPKTDTVSNNTPGAINATPDDTLSQLNESTVSDMTTQSADDLFLNDQEGIIDFWEQEERYTISYSIPNTIDSQVTCVVRHASMIPEELRVPGAKIIFSGVVTTKGDLPKPVLGGQKIVMLKELTSIQPSN